MEAGDRFNKDEIYRIPLTVFDVVRIQKRNEASVKVNEVIDEDSIKDERSNKEFCFTLNDLF